MTLAPSLGAQILEGVGDGVYLPAEHSLRLSERGREIAQGRLANDEKIYIASGALAPGGHGPIDEGERDPVAKGIQRLPKYI